MKRFLLTKAVAVSIIVVMLVAMLSACGNNNGKQAESSSKASVDQTAVTVSQDKGDLKYKGKITFFAQAYHPIEPTKTNPNPPTMFREVAKKYAELHPGIEIEFIPSLEGQDYNAWLKTKISAGMAPDIFWEQCADLNSGTIPIGSVYNMNDYLQKPNPYIDGNQKWEDIFYPSMQKQIAGPNGEHFNIDADYVGTAVIYNKDMFKKAGIENTPKNWTEFIDVNKKLKAAGFTPWAFSFGNDPDSAQRITWFSRLFITNFYKNDFSKLAVEGSTISLTTTENLVAFKKGIFGTDDPRWMGWWPLVKDQIPYMQKDSTSAAMTPQGVMNMFINKQVAMYFDGTWSAKQLKDAKVDFEFGTFSFPTPDPACSQYAVDFDTSAADGGPFAAFQFAISTPKANSTMNDDKMKACVDWLMFSTKPENVEAIVNELGIFIPAVKGAKASEANASLQKLMESESLVIDAGTNSMGAGLMDIYYRTFQQYLEGKVTLEEAQKILKPVVEKEVDKKISDNKLDLSKYLK